MLSAREALGRLREGNRRFVSATRGRATSPGHPERVELRSTQEPFAIIVGCSDSRVPPELVFDQGLGDLFVVRVAGNVAGPTQVGSVEFGALQLGARLVVVLGHSECGAIEATCTHLRESTGLPSPDLQSIVDMIRPSIEPLLATEAARDWNGLLREAVRANVRSSAERLRSSEALERLMGEAGLLVVGAEYSVTTGAVEFFENEEPR